MYIICASALGPLANVIPAQKMMLKTVWRYGAASIIAIIYEVLMIRYKDFKEFSLKLVGMVTLSALMLFVYM